MLQHLTANLAGLVRHAKLEGRDYLVVPTVILTEGVHAGSNGPLFYPADELAASAPTWNHKPILVYHAMDESGNYCSASDKGVIERQKVGFLLNTVWRDNRLVSEAWIETDRAAVIDPRIMTTLQQNRMMEVSTGLFTENEDKPGEFNGATYNSVARKYHPDHLALLPDQIGACSINAGCGLLRLNHTVSKQTSERLSRFIDRVVANDCNCGGETSLDDLRRQVEMQLREKYPNQDNANMPSGVWVLDMYQDYVVYERDNKFYKQAYMKPQGKVELHGDPVEVIRTSGYQEVTSNAFCPTGAGGGVDPSCGKEGGEGGESKKFKITGRGEGNDKFRKGLKKRVTDSKKPGQRGHVTTGTKVKDERRGKTVGGPTIKQAAAALAKKGMTLGKPVPWRPGDKETKYTVTDKDGKSQVVGSKQIQKLMTNTQQLLTTNCSGGGCQCGGKCSEAKSAGTNKKESQMDREQVINQLIASGVWTEAERPILNKMDDPKLQNLAQAYMDDSEREEDPVPGHEAGKKKKDVVIPESGEMKSGMPFAANMSLQDFINMAPVEYKEVIVNGLQSAARQKGELIGTITANTANPYSKDELEQMNLNQLEKLAKLARAAMPTNNQQFGNIVGGTIQPIYSGQTGGGITANQGSEDKEPLTPPTMNFAEYREKTYGRKTG